MLSLMQEEHLWHQMVVHYQEKRAVKKIMLTVNLKVHRKIKSDMVILKTFLLLYKI